MRRARRVNPPRLGGYASPLTRLATRAFFAPYPPVPAEVNAQDTHQAVGVAHHHHGDIADRPATSA
jgi:hypothetical protein